MGSDRAAKVARRCWQAKLIAKDSKSIFHRVDTAFAQFLKQMETTFSLHHDQRGLDHGPIWKGEWREP